MHGQFTNDERVESKGSRPLFSSGVTPIVLLPALCGQCRATCNEVVAAPLPGSMAQLYIEIQWASETFAYKSQSVIRNMC